MTIRTHKARNFTTVSNSMACDKSLSWEARGLLLYLLSRPDGWEVQRGDLINQSPAGRDKVQGILRELESAGYLVRWKERVQGGKFAWRSEIFESQEDCAQWRSENDHDGYSGHGTMTGKTVDGQTVDGRTVDGRTVDGRTVDGKPGHLLNTDSTKTELVKTDQSKTETKISLSQTPSQASTQPVGERAPEPEREREEFSDQALRAFVSKRLKKTCKVNLSAYVNAALRNDRDVWVREYRHDQEKRRRNDSERAAIANQPDFVANLIEGVKQSSASRAEIALRRENFTRQWDSYPERRTQLEALLSHQPELGLFAMDGELCELCELGEVAA
jgi:hypothetical protein